MKLLTTIFLMSFLNSFGRDISISDSLFEEHSTQVSLIEDAIQYQKHHKIPKGLVFKAQIIYVGCTPSMLKDSVLKTISDRINSALKGYVIIDFQKEVFQVPIMNASIDYCYRHYEESFDEECYKEDFINVYIVMKFNAFH